MGRWETGVKPCEDDSEAGGVRECAMAGVANMLTTFGVATAVDVGAGAGVTRTGEFETKTGADGFRGEAGARVTCA